MTLTWQLIFNAHYARKMRNSYSYRKHENYFYYSRSSLTKPNKFTGRAVTGNLKAHSRLG